MKEQQCPHQMTHLCLCVCAPHAKGLASDHLTGMAEQDSTRGHVLILKHQASCLLCKPAWKKKETYVCPSPCCRMADCWDNLFTGSLLAWIGKPPWCTDCSNRWKHSVCKSKVMQPHKRYQHKKDNKISIDIQNLTRQMNVLEASETYYRISGHLWFYSECGITGSKIFFLWIWMTPFNGMTFQNVIFVVQQLGVISTSTRTWWWW